MTRTGAIVLRWTTPVRGREAAGLDVFGDALQYYEELAKEGRIISHREYFRTGGEGGMMIVEGFVPELHLIMQEDAFVRLQLRAGAIVDDFECELVAGGSDRTVQELMTAYTEELTALGYL
ncbi:MAG: hypothetical protein HYU28_12325 [Actinobacteria bacterium]|nr:hypothetical protein [Actinomycetota bacterium]